MAVSNSLTKTKEQKTFSNFLMGDAIKRKINETVGGANGQRFITSILSAVSTNPTLQECEHSSIISAAFLGEALKLSPSPQLGQYYMVPFNKKSYDANGKEIVIKVAQFQIGYKGYIQLAERTGVYKTINVLAIKEGELIKYDPLNETIQVNLIEDDEVREETPTVGYYAMFEYLNGFRKTMYWTKKKMLLHADKYSKAFNKESYEKLQAGKIPQKDLWKYSSFWYKDFDGMAYKTMLRQLISKWGIMSIEMQEAFEKDMAEIKEDGNYNYIENSEEADISNNETQQLEENNQESQEEITTNEKSVPEPEQQPEETNIYDDNNNDVDDFFKQ